MITRVRPVVISGGVCVIKVLQAIEIKSSVSTILSFVHRCIVYIIIDLKKQQHNYNMFFICRSTSIIFKYDWKVCTMVDSNQCRNDLSLD